MFTKRFRTFANKSMKIILAIDSFKGCLTSTEVNQAAAEGVRRVCPDAKVVQIPVSDGGEGFLEAFESAIGGERVEMEVCDPLMRPVTAAYLLQGNTAVIEMAQASGLTLLSKAERNPMVTTSYGTGQLVADAVRKRADHIVVGLGGSATSDAGAGMIRALIDSFAKNGHWNDIEELKNIRFTIASDVRNPLCGEQGAAYVFAPQKGATPEMVRQLDERARLFAEESAQLFGYDRQELPGAGAAGGLGYAFLQYLNAECRSGIELLLETIHYEKLVKDADLVITGEGSADCQTLMGKLPMGILQHSGDTPVYLIAGRIADKDNLLNAGFARLECINPDGISLDEAMRKEVATRNIIKTVSRLLKG
jgi:glycerate kinase